MTGHGLSTIHPAKALLQEAKPHALTRSHAAAPIQNGGNMGRLSYANRTDCPPQGRYPSLHTTIELLSATAPTRNHHSSSHAPRGSYM